jgi:hypothetical protein
MNQPDAYFHVIGGGICRTVGQASVRFMCGAQEMSALQTGMIFAE